MSFTYRQLRSISSNHKIAHECHHRLKKTTQPRYSLQNNFYVLKGLPVIGASKSIRLFSARNKASPRSMINRAASS